MQMYFLDNDSSNVNCQESVGVRKLKPKVNVSYVLAHGPIRNKPYWLSYWPSPKSRFIIVRIIDDLLISVTNFKYNKNSSWH